MATMRKKIELPAKTCPVCRRTFVWRKRWGSDWNAVRYCSEACRSERTSSGLPILYHADRITA